MAATKKDVHPKSKTPEDKDSEGSALRNKTPEGKDSEGSALRNKAPEGKDSEGSALKDKTPEGKDMEDNALKDKTPSGGALKGAAKPAGRAAPERRYTVACAVLGALTAVGFAACFIFSDEWGMALFFPLLGAAVTALLWCALVRLCFCRDPERLLARDFTRALRRALELPVCTGITALLCLLPEDIPFSVAILLMLLLLAAVPVSAVLGIWSVCSAVRHLRTAPPSAPSIYREGPLVLAVLLLVAELAALGWLAVYLFI